MLASTLIAAGALFRLEMILLSKCRRFGMDGGKLLDAAPASSDHRLLSGCLHELESLEEESSSSSPEIPERLSSPTVLQPPWTRMLEGILLHGSFIEIQPLLLLCGPQSKLVAKG